MKIPPEHIVEKVMAALAVAQKSVRATMLLSEELSQPLPVAYFALLESLLQRGVVIHRQAFGTPEELEKFAWKDPCKDYPQYHVKLQEVKPYRRMILIDGKKLFYKEDGVFHFSEAPEVISELFQYFQS